MEMIIVMARSNPFAEHAEMTKFASLNLTQHILEVVAEFKKLGFAPYLLPVQEYNKRLLKERVPQVKAVLSRFSYPYNRRIAGQHGCFTLEDYRKWLEKMELGDLSRALRCLAQLNRSQVYVLETSVVLIYLLSNYMFFRRF
jgi:hypothetical protein